VCPVDKSASALRPPTALVKKDSVAKPKNFTVVRAVH
jgi:hypothetical protein